MSKMARIKMGNGTVRNRKKVKAVSGGPMAVRRKKSVATCLAGSMNLNELLEASNVVAVGVKGQSVPVIKSPKVKKYANVVLSLNKNADTRPIAEKMIQDLNVQIVETNRKTIDVAESKRVYHEFMAEK